MLSLFCGLDCGYPSNSPVGLQKTVSISTSVTTIIVEFRRLTFILGVSEHDQINDRAGNKKHDLIVILFHVIKELAEFWLDNFNKGSQKQKLFTNKL